MPEPYTRITRKIVKDMPIASIRFLGQMEEVDAHLEHLREQVGPFVDGPPMILRHYGGNPIDGADLEVALPTSQPVDLGKVKSRVLPGGWMVCATHVGPYGSRDTADGLTQCWQEVGAYMYEKNLGFANSPLRLVRLQGRAEHGDNDRLYVTEIQVPLLLPEWIGNLATGTEQYAGAAARGKVMANQHYLTVYSTAQEAIDWIRGAIERLDATVPDEGVRQAIMICCSHRFPRWRIENLRAAYRKEPNLERLLQIMLSDRNWRGAAFVRDRQLGDNVLTVVKVPADTEQYRQTTDEQEKRYHYCHCTMVREAIRTGVQLPRTFCLCGAGWYDQLWGGILERPVRIELQRSVLQGDKFCRFAIHLPADVR